MGDYFVMSTRFNKCDACDFGLIAQDSNIAINPVDNSMWIKSSLYDLGWGNENGFYKIPLPNADKLFEIALFSCCKEDMYGAASIILEQYPEKLLSKCEELMNDPSKIPEFKRVVELFKLELPINRSSIVKKTYEQIQQDYLRWKIISDRAMKLMLHK